MSDPIPSHESRPSWLLPLIALVAVAAVAISWYFMTGRGRDALIVYCAHDAVYSEQILREFERQTGIPIDIRFDTEATKSLGLVELIRRERDQPRCDVFWNNEQLGTMQLADDGLLEPYKGAVWQMMPAAYKDPDGRWTGFAGRLRVWIVNTDKMPATAEAVEQQLAQPSLSHVAIAKPLYGTTRTHYTVLWDRWGADGLKLWHHDWRQRGVIEATGNAHVKNLVASGAATLGLTDSDDVFVAVDEGKPVEMLPYRLEDGSVICIPNTVAIIRGSDQMAAAQRLVDYLLMQELILAASKSRQIPLRQEWDKFYASDEVMQMMQWAQRPTDLTRLGNAAHECLTWLKAEYAP